MTAKAPYTFPHHSRKAMIDYCITRDRSRGYQYKTYPFCWNVKAYAFDFDGDTLRKHMPDLDPAFDAAWDAHAAANDEFFNWCVEDARRQIDGNDWTAYPGVGQGDWKFEFVGRSGGWLTLLKWEEIDATQFHADEDEAKDYRTMYEDPMHGDVHNLYCWPMDKLRRFYKGIRTADTDFTSDKATAEVEYQAAFQREQWEDNLREERDQAATTMAALMEYDRPDLYEFN